MVPFAAVLLNSSAAAPIWAAVILLIAAITDYCDGIIARKRSEVSDIGKFLDPLADKLFVAAGLIIMIGLDEINVSAWMVIIIVFREFIISSLRTYAATKGRVMAAIMAGKIKTALQLAGLFLLLMMLALLRRDMLPSLNMGALSYLITLIMTLYTLYSGIVYIVKNIDILK